jgi:hypothetical protein
LPRLARGFFWENGNEPVRHDPHVLAIATDVPPRAALPIFDLLDIDGIADLVRTRARHVAGEAPRLVATARR